MADVEITVGLDTKELNKDAKKTDKTLKDLDKAQKQVEEGFKSGKEAADIFGGSLGAAAGALEKAKNSAAAASAALGPVGVAAAAAGVALIATGFAAFKAVEGYVALVNAAGEAAARLAELEGTGLTETDINTIDRARDSLGALGIVADEITVIFGVDAANAFEDVQRVVLKLSFITRDFTETLSENADLIRLVATVLNPQLVSTFDNVVKSVEVLDRATTDYDAEVEKYIKLAEEQRTADERKAAAAAFSAKATKEAAEEEKRRLKVGKEFLDALEDIAKAEEDLADIIQAAAADQLTDLDKINMAYQEQIVIVDGLEEATGNVALAVAARAALEERHIRDVIALTEELNEELTETEENYEEAGEAARGAFEGINEEGQKAIDQATDLLEVTGDLFQAFADLASLRIDQIQDQIDAREEWLDSEFASQRAAVERLRETGDISQAEADAELERIDIEEEAARTSNNKLTKIQKEQALEAFYRQQQLSKTAALMNGAAAIVAAFAQLGPIGGAIAAIGIGITTGVQIATINAQDPPTFPHGAGQIGDAIGGDHSLVGVQPTEGVLTPRGVSRAGGPQGVEAMNRGAPMIPEIKIEIDGVGFARAIARNQGAAKTLAKALQPHLKGAF